MMLNDAEWYWMISNDAKWMILNDGKWYKMLNDS